MALFVAKYCHKCSVIENLSWFRQNYDSVPVLGVNIRNFEQKLLKLCLFKFSPFFRLISRRISPATVRDQKIAKTLKLNIFSKFQKAFVCC